MSRSKIVGCALVATLLVLGLGRAARATNHTSGVGSVTEANGGVVIHQGNIWNVWAPSNHSTGTTGSVRVFAASGANSVAVGGSSLQSSGSVFTPAYTSESTINVCTPGAAFPFDGSHCDFNENLGIEKTFAGDDDLGMIYIDGNQISSSFSEFTTSGSEITVPGTKSSIVVSATPVDSNGASFKVNGNAGQQTVNLNAKGVDTVVTVTGVGNNGTSTQNYTFTVHRGLSNADLSNLTISPGSITGFSSSTTEYSTSVPKATTEVAVTPTLSDANGSYAVDVDGTPVADPAHTPISATDTTIHVVTSSDSTLTHKTYSIAVHRGIANADLSDLTISPGSISSFSPSTTSYSTKVPSTATEVAVASTTADANASTAVDVGGTPVADPAHTPLAASDPSTIHVVVTADDTTTQKTYTITVTHLLSEGLHAVFAGNGKGTVTSTSPDTTINCTAPSTGTCLANYDEGTGVTLAEAPATGSFFNGWSGDCGTGSDTTISFTMPSAAAACTATFTSLGAKQSGTAPKVNTQNDDASSSDHNCYAGRCSLRDALASVTNNGTITFAGGVTNLHLDEGLSFDAAGKTASIAGTGVTVDGTDVGGDPTLNLVNGTLKITGLTIAHNSEGGGLANQSGTLNLTNVVVNDNGAFLGGGIVTSGTTTMTGGEISENGSFACAGIYLQAGTTTLTNVSVVSNESEVAGGGACVSSGSTLNITGGEVSGNEVCGFCGGGGGGGIDVDGGTLNANGTQIDGNNATSGAGILVETGDGPGNATLTNVTLFNNQGDWALTADSPNVAKLINTTVVGNQGGVRSGDGTAVLLNTLLAGNNGQDCDPSNNPSSLGHNVSDDSSCSSLVATGDQANVSAHLGDEENGVVPLDNGSPALNSGATGTVSGLTVPTKDALGTTRPQGSGVDVGALEMTFHKLTIKIAGPGKGSVDPPSGSYVAGSSVHLTATPDVGSGSAFVGWSGACTGTDVGTDVVMSADETCTATFAAPPHITAFAPSSGRIRSTITLTGSGFTGVTEVTVGGHDADFKVTGDTKIAVTVPDDANTGDNLITVTGPADHSTVGPWKLTWPAPKITAFTPAKAGGGQTVTVTGTGFLGAFAADFHGQDVTPTVVSDTKITLVVPATPDSTGLISITTPGDTVTSKTPFTFIPLPVVDNPSSAVIGATILITGANFTGATAVRIGGVAAKFKVVNGASIQLVVPDNLTDGPIAVTTPGGTGASAGNFVHSFLKPVITSFTPVKGPIRSTVTLTGSHFRGSTELSFGGHDATDWTIVSDTKITAKVPDSAETGKIALTNSADTGLSSVNFTVSWVKPTISSFTPLTGPTGTTVTINGTGFLGTTSVHFGTTAATDVTVVSATKITVVVPDGATSGKVTVTTPGGTATSVKSYTVT